MKKIIAVCMSFMLLVTLAACGSQDTKTTQNSTVQAEKDPTPATSAPDKTENEEQKEPGQEPSNAASDGNSEAAEGKTLVVYYSATGSRKKVAGYIASAVNGEVFELKPVEPYTSEDLDWTNKKSRVSNEHDNPDKREVALVTASVPDWESYETVFIGYPIWWGIAAWPVDGFIKANDFTGKTVIPFCTSASSGLGESGKLLKEAAGAGNWLDGERFSSGVSESTVTEWVEGLGLK